MGFRQPDQAATGTSSRASGGVVASGIGDFETMLPVKMTTVGKFEPILGWVLNVSLKRFLKILKQRQNKESLKTQ